MVKKQIFISILLLIISLAPVASFAQEAISLTVTPPLFQLNISPGESWSSTIKALNGGAKDISVYANVVNFAPQDEEGHGKFIPLVGSEVDRDTLASWITVSSEPVRVVAGGEARIPFTLSVPPDASPGGHYGAILINTQPPAGAADGTQVSVASAISSLFLVRVAGEVQEEGHIREFSIDKSVYQSPKVDFTLRFENTGNVHLKPQGEIALYNMWGRPAGTLTVNQEANFGNVLPKSVRNFTLSWQGSGGFFQVGRYTATVTLTYGSDERHNVTQSVAFWVIPVVPTLGILAGVATFAGLVALLVRWYVRRALHAAGASTMSRQSPPVAYKDSHETLDLRRRFKK